MFLFKSRKFCFDKRSMTQCKSFAELESTKHARVDVYIYRKGNILLTVSYDKRSERVYCFTYTPLSRPATHLHEPCSLHPGQHCGHPLCRHITFSAQRIRIGDRKGRILSYYIDASTLLENIPLVKFTTSRTVVAFFFPYSHV